MPPVYEYEILGPDGAPRGLLEVRQKMSDPALTHHPETGEPLRRVLSSTFARTAGSSADFPFGPSGCGPAFGFGGGCAGGACGLS